MPISKTEDYCTCGMLQQAAETAGTPVKFDKEMNEFRLVHDPDNAGGWILRHCFFCGGKAPNSLREYLFMRLTKEERWRLINLTKPLKTVEDVITALGKPDSDMEAGSSITYPEKDGNPEQTTYYRTLSYRNLSETANVRVMVYPAGQVAFSIGGKALKQISGDK